MSTMARITPATIQIQHQAYVFDSGTDARGNPTGALGAPVSRFVIGFYRPGMPTDPISVDFLARTIAELMMMSYEPTVYNKLDNVLVFDGDQTLAYEVQNQPISWSIGYPWQHYAHLLGGEVHLRRVE